MVAPLWGYGCPLHHFWVKLASPMLSRLVMLAALFQ
jgi:hypothetical protein